MRRAIVAATLLLSISCAQWQAIYPELDKIEQIVAADLAAGKALVQIEADVAALLCGSSAAPLCVDIVVVVNDAISFLINTGILAKREPAAMPYAQRMLAEEQTKIAARAHK